MVRDPAMESLENLGAAGGNDPVNIRDSVLGVHHGLDGLRRHDDADVTRLGVIMIQTRNTNRYPIPKPRAGFTMIEAVVSAGLLMVVMSFVVQMTFRIDGVWGDTHHHRIAIQELSNQLDRLTRLSVEEIQTELQQLQPSEAIHETLHEATISGELVKDEFGQRVALQLNWDKRQPGKPMEMSAWLRQPDDTTQEPQE